MGCWTSGLLLWRCPSTFNPCRRFHLQDLHWNCCWSSYRRNWSECNSPRVHKHRYPLCILFSIYTEWVSRVIVKQSLNFNCSHQAIFAKFGELADGRNCSHSWWYGCRTDSSHAQRTDHGSWHISKSLSCILRNTRSIFLHCYLLDSRSDLLSPSWGSKVSLPPWYSSRVISICHRFLEKMSNCDVTLFADDGEWESRVPGYCKQPAKELQRQSNTGRVQVSKYGFVEELKLEISASELRTGCRTGNIPIPWVENIRMKFFGWRKTESSSDMTESNNEMDNLSLDWLVFILRNF